MTVAETDGEYQASESFDVVVNPINDSPSMVAIQNVSTLEESEVSVGLNATDIDGDTEFTFNAESESDLFTLSLTESVLTVTPISNATGDGSITVYANDGELSSASISFDVSIQNVNDAPILSSVSNPDAVNEDGENISITLSASDVDGDDISFSIDADNDDMFAAISIDGSVVTLDPANDVSGTSAVYVFATDGVVTVSDEFIVTVNPVNDPPILASISSSEFAEEGTISIPLNGSDIDNSTLLYLASSNENVSTSFSGNILNITGVQDFFGSLSLDISVSDGELSDTKSLNLNITPVNDAPILNEVSDVSFDEDGVSNLNLSATDVDEDSLTYSIEGGTEITTVEENGAISFSASQDYNGSESFVVSVFDGEVSDSQTITVTVNPVNDAPVLSAVGNKNVDEDAVLNFLLSANDIEGNQLTYSIDGGSQVLASISGNDLTFTPDVDFYGEETFTVSVTDGDLSDSEEIILTVNAVNDAPVLSQVSDVSFDEDGSGSTSLSADDVDGDDLTFSITGGDSITATLDGSSVSFGAPADYNGSEVFVVSVDDGETSDSQTLNVTVNAVNDAPVAAVGLSGTADEDGSVVITLSGSDVDGDNLTFSAGSALNGSVSLDGSFATYTPDENYFGDDSFTFTVSDGSEDDSATVSLTVNAVNDAPVLSQVSDVSFDEDGSGSTSLSADDVDGDDLTFSITGGDSITATLDGSSVSFGAPADYNGSEVFVVSVDDGETSDSQTLNVTVNAVNDAPVAAVGLSGTADESIVVLLSSFDVEGDALSYLVTSEESEISATLSGTELTFSAPENYYGNQLFTVTVSDGDLEDSEDIMVTIVSVNDVPVIVSSAVLDATEDIQYSYQVSIEDPDNDSFNYSLSDHPDGMIISDSGLITWTPTEGILTSGEVTLTVDDGDLSATELFEITVLAVNDPPVIVSSASVTATEDIEYTYQVQVEDPDDSIFNYTLVQSPEGMVVDGDGLLTWIPLEGILTSGLVTLSVEDSFSEITYEQFVIEVTAINDAPLIVSEAIDMVYLDYDYSYQLTIEDPDDDVFDYNLQNAPVGMTISDSGLINWTPEVVGTYGPITVSVSDGGEDGASVAIQEFSIEVQYLYTVANYDLYEGNNLISFYSIPPESDEVSFVFDSVGSSISNIFGEGAYAQQIPNFGWIGSLQQISPEDGYWVRMSEDTPFNVYGLPIGIIEYEVHSGANLLSYPYDFSQDVQAALPDDVEDKIYAIFGQNISALNINGMWLGSLSSFEPGKGYWYIANEPFVFEYNTLAGSSFSRNYLDSPPSEIDYYQSTQQAFYFIEQLNLNHYNVESGDWIVAYNGETIVGSRMWNGNYTDIPVMGFDSGSQGEEIDADLNTYGYCKAGDTPSFKLYKPITGEYINLESSDIPSWSSNNVFVVSNLEDEQFPMELNLHSAYPNPFNPSTTITYEIPFGSFHVNLSVYDLRGRLVDVLVDRVQDSQVEPYSVLWNANEISSGVYFIRLHSGDMVKTQKVMLVK